jgi:serine/threonine protein kinase
MPVRRGAAVLVSRIGSSGAWAHPARSPRDPLGRKITVHTDASESSHVETNDLDGMEQLPRPGELIAGRFRVESVLGVGGMGIVLGCRHLHLNQRVALKLLRKEATRSPEAVTRFLREARAAAAINNDHVVRIIDVGTMRSTRTEDSLEVELPFIVMEMLSGTDLDRMLHARGPLPISEAVDYVLQACTAVAAAHALGIVHRDLKPANLFVTQVPDDLPLVKVLDFGISKMTQPDGFEEENRKLTRTGMMVGSPVYMSPEQVRGSETDSRSDIWALGSILHEILTGQLPFDADTSSALYAKIIADPPAPLRSLRKDAPAGLEAVVFKCLEKDIERRFANVQELARALQPFAGAPLRRSVESLLQGPRSKGAAVAAAPGARPSHKAAGESSRRVWSMVAVAAAALALGGLLAFVLTTRGTEQHAAGTAPPAGETALPAISAEPPASATAEPAQAPSAVPATPANTPSPAGSPAPSTNDSPPGTGSVPGKASRPDAPAKSAAARPPTTPTSLPAPSGGDVHVDPLEGRK